MRDIIFRGKRLDNGEWVEGNLFIPDKPDTPTQIRIGTNGVRICYDVNPSTIFGFADDILDDEACDIEVIGNVHDSCELLKGDVDNG